MRSGYKGIFFLTDEERVAGELSVDPSNGTAEVLVWGLGDLTDVPESLGSDTLYGVVWEEGNTQIISAFGCQFSGRYGFGITGGMYRAWILFSFAALGGREICADEPIVTAVQFFFAGFEESQLETGGFDAVISPDADLRAQVERSVSAKRQDDYTLGENPVIGFYDGRDCDLGIPGTVLGEVKINARQVTIGSGKPLEKHGPFVRLTFDEPVSLLTAKHRLGKLRGFVALVVGVVPRLTEFRADSVLEGQTPRKFVVVNPNDRLDQGSNGQASIGMSLLNPITRKDEFRVVATNWLERNEDQDRSHSNLRFLSHFGKNSYNEERLIGAVNMFDLLPLSEKEYSNGKQIKRIETVINRRAKKVQARLGDDKLPKLDYVIRCAVNGRNHFTHGTPASVDFRVGGNIAFMTKALEFVYGVGELLECGWDLSSWLNECRRSAHPFGAFLRDYRKALRKLESAST